MTETALAADVMPEDESSSVCLLRHAVFGALARISFRRAVSDGTPVMVMPMGDMEASVPLRSLQREFGIDDDSADGRMLGLIAESLDYVSFLQPGDPIPAEVLSGLASWQPAPSHRLAAAGRLRLQLLRLLDADCPIASAMLKQLDGDKLLRGPAETGGGHAAQGDVIARFEQLSDELAFIEALRHRLHRRVQALTARLHRLGGRRQDGERTHMLIQVQRLSQIGLQRIAGRFEEVDAQTGDILAALGNMRGQQAFIRSNRDWLYRCQRAWDPVLASWEERGATLDPAMWQLIASTYQFLAPRYMPVQEWRVALARNPARRRKKARAGMAW